MERHVKMPDHEQPLLSVRDLAVAFDGKAVLDRISFDINPSEVLAVIGPNGSGKTVLLKTLVGLVKPAGGTVHWAPDARIGYLPQRFHVDTYLPMTVLEFLKLRASDTASLGRALEMAELGTAVLTKGLAHVSSGELQRVLLAWVLIGKPTILLFDEPTENVDVVRQESIYSLLHDLQDRLHIAVILVSHDLHVVYRYANHVLCLNREMICYGEPQRELTTEKLAELYGDHAFFHHHHFGDRHHG